MRRPYRFSPPTPADWADSWSGWDEPRTRRDYLAACWQFDSVLGSVVPAGQGKDALEVGCFPGGFMSYLHRRFGYRVSGIDYVPPTSALAEQLTREGVDVGTVTVGDVRDLPAEPRFDLVASFGLIEHFEDPAEIIRIHSDWLAPSGWLVLEMPHFRRLQWLFHRTFDERSLRGHNLRAMDAGALRHALESCGLTVVRMAYAGVCNAWHEPDPRRSPRVERLANVVEGGLGKVDATLRRAPVPLANPLTSPFLLCVARRA